MANKDNEQKGAPEDISFYDLPGADLSILPISKDRFKELMLEHNVPVAPAKVLWGHYTKEIGRIYDQLRANEALGLGSENAKLTKGLLETGKFDRAGFDKMAKENGIDLELANDLWLTFETEITAVGEQLITTQEKAEAEAQEQKEAKEADESETYTTPAEARLFLEQIRGNPKHAYNNVNATQEQHEKAVEAVNRLIAITMGQASNLDGIHDEINKKYAPKIEDRSSASGGNTNKSFEQPDINPDSIAQGGKSSASGHKIKDGGEEEVIEE